ncbi:MAG: cyclic nucleotide-binding domain-containing protein [Lachnospiraceae bacterium]|nr:cyclic nucleotide-binding domain-containing protein [Candidatus Colinaster equi]
MSKQHYMRTYEKDRVIFEEGTYSNTMYIVESGRIGIFKEYGTPNQVKLAEVDGGMFGEMGLVSDAPRSATAVALETSELELVPRTELSEYFEAFPYMKEQIIDTLSKRIRQSDRDYMKVCGCIKEFIKLDEANEKKSPELIAQMKKYASMA